MTEPEAAPSTTVVEVPAEETTSVESTSTVPEAPAPEAPASEAPASEAPASTEVTSTEQPAPEPEPTESAPPAAPTALVTTPAEPVAPVPPAEPVAPTAQPAAPAPRTTEPTTTTAPTTAAPASPAQATTPTTTSAPTTTGQVAPATTAAQTTTARSRPAPVAAAAPDSAAPTTSVAVQDAAAASARPQRRSTTTLLAPKSDPDPTPTRESIAAVEAAPPAAVQQVSAPQTLQAPEQDVQLAKSVKPIERKPDPAPPNEIADLAKAIDVALPVGAAARPARTEGARVVQANAISWDRNIRQWSPNWVRYDKYYRPVIANPYRDPVRIIYVYENAPRVVTIPPLQSVVMDVAQLAAYSFTAVVTNAVNTAVNVAVGSFFGGGYTPAVGLPLPPPPAPVLRYDNVPIQVRYSSATYEPFVVRQIVDVGNDPQYGGHKVLLDGVTPVWGQWVQNPAGHRQFEVYKTQQFPGLDTPAEVPLPGDYRLRLASDTVEPSSSDTNKYLAIAAAAAAGLSLGLVGLSVYLGRRRPQV